MSSVRVHAQASDRLTRAGLTSALGGLAHCVDLVDTIVEAEVVVHASHVLSGSELCLLRAQAEQHLARLVLVADRLPGIGLDNLVACRIHAVLGREEFEPESLGRAIRAAHRGDGVFPPALQGSLVAQLGRLQSEVLSPAGQTLGGLNQRDIEVLRLVSEGLGTSEIATKLAYSERTVKNSVQCITTSLGARNRAQAVAQAVREGLF